MEIKEIRRRNLEQLIQEKYGNQAGFVRETGINQGELSAILRGQKSFGEKKARKLEQDAGLPSGWLDQDHTSDNVTPAGTQDTVPLISWVAAGTWTPMSDQSSEYKQVLCPFPHGKGTFALEVHGISMENPDLKPSFSEGDWIYVDPTREAHHRDFVIVRLDDSNEATFKQLLIEGSQKMLFALNKDWKPRILPINGNATIIGVVIGKVERW